MHQLQHLVSITHSRFRNPGEDDKGSNLDRGVYATDLLCGGNAGLGREIVEQNTRHVSHTTLRLLK